MKRHERNGPARTAILEPGHDLRSFVSAGDLANRYSKIAALARFGGRASRSFTTLAAALLVPTGQEVAR